MAPRRKAVAIAVAAGFAAAAQLAEARITRIEINEVQSPTYVNPDGSGRVFGSVGAYEKLRGTAHGELDPSDPQNAIIVDLDLAPRNSHGKVEYSMDIFILKPIDLSKGNQRLFVDVNNRGEMRVGRLNDVALSNNPKTAAQAGTGFIFNLGYAVTGNGWDPGATNEDDGLTINVGGAVKNRDGTTITGPSYEYIVLDSGGTTSQLTYPAANLDKSKAKLTRRAHLDDAPQPVDASAWSYVGDKSITVTGGFLPSWIYEFTYTAKDPIVSGIGLAATRDWVSFLRHAKHDDFGNANPLAHHVRHTFSFTISQPARYINDFQTLGFNGDERGRRVIDGVLNWTGGGSGVFINYRFSQNGRTERNRQNHLYPEGVFPFAYQKLRDHLTGQKGGRGVRCAADDDDDHDRGGHHGDRRDRHDRDDDEGFCPKAIEANSANEYWVKAGSLLHTDTRGNDLSDPENVRYFLMSGVQHGQGNNASRGICQQFTNGNSADPALRALLVALDEWVTAGRKPPKSEVPRRANGTAVVAVPRPGSQVGVVPQAALGWPNIPGVTYTGVITTRYLLDFGPDFDDGILSNYPPSVVGRPVYPNFVSKVDTDGNEIAGVRLPAVAAPVATTTGWALRRADRGGNDGCESAGQFIPFAKTLTERQLSGDPRRSLEERYGNHAGYVAAVRTAAEDLGRRRLLLPEDVQRYVDAAEASNVLR